MIGLRIILMVLLLLSNVAQAEGEASLSAVIYKKLLLSQQRLEGDNVEETIDELKSLADNKTNSEYENGMMWHLMGYGYWRLGKLPESIKALSKALDFDLPKGLNLNNRKMLAQVYMQNNQCQQAVPHFRFWLSNSDEPKEDMLVLTAQCYYQMKRYKSAVKLINEAITLYKSNNQQPKESWLTLLQHSLAHLDDAKHRIDTIKLLLTWYPKPEYWLALAGAYAQLEKMDNYLAVLSLAKRKNLLNTEAQYLSLASMYFSQQAPIKAAQVLEEGLSRSIVKHNVKNLRFLASSYSMAREYDKAINPLTMAAKKANNGKVHLLLGNAYYQLARWQEAADAFEMAIEKGELEQTANAWMLMGQSYIYLKQFNKAIAAFEQAALDESKAEQAEQWLQYIAYERNRYESLGLETN